MDCSIIIVSYNSSPITDRCLMQATQSVEYAKQQTNIDTEIIVVDNASTDDSVEIIKHKYPHVKLIQSDTNLGYSKANNLAMRQSNANYFLLLNSDAFLEPDTLFKAFQYMHNNPHTDMLSVKLHSPDGNLQASGGYLPTPLRTIQWTLGLESFPIIKKIIHPFYQFQQNFYTKEQKMDWATTCFSFLKRQVFEQTGGFDENIFLYMEDVEWCQRIKNKNFTIIFNPDISVTHIGGYSTKKLSNQRLLQQHINGLRYYHQKHFPHTLAIVTNFLKFGLAIRAVFYFLTKHEQEAQAYFAVLFS